MEDVKDNRRITFDAVQALPNPEDSVQEDQFEPFTSIMDRVQVKVLDEMVRGEDGVLTPPKYRQHSNKGIVISVGQWVVIGGKQIPLDFLKPGDKVLFGEYNCEKFVEGDVEYELVRVQDIRGVERLRRTDSDANDSQEATPRG